MKKHIFISDYLSNRGGYKASRNNIFFLKKKKKNSIIYDLNSLKNKKISLYKFFTYKFISFLIKKIFYNLEIPLTIPQFFSLIDVENNKNHYYHIHYAYLIFNYDYIKKNPKSKFIIYIYDEWWLNSVHHFEKKNKYFWEDVIKEKKIDLLLQENVTVVCSTQFIFDKVNNFKKKNIFKQIYYIDWRKWKPKNKKKSRAKFFLDQKLFYILFIARSGSENTRKGGHYLKQISKKLLKYKNIKFLILGQYNLEKVKNKFCSNIELISLDKDEDLVDLYSSVDLNLTLSIQENLPYSILESLSCGVPNISFDTGGCCEILSNGYNGYLIKKKNLQQVKRNIFKCVKKNMKKNSRASIKQIKFKNFDKFLNS